MVERNENPERNVNEENDTDSSDDDTIVLENPNNIHPVIEEEKEEEKNDQNETSTPGNNNEPAEIMFTEMLTSDIFSLTKKFFKHDSLKHLRAENCLKYATG